MPGNQGEGSGGTLWRDAPGIGPAQADLGMANMQDPESLPSSLLQSQPFLLNPQGYFQRDNIRIRNDF